MPTERFVCPAGLAVAVVDRGIARLERTGTPDPDAARELLRLAVELESGDLCPAVDWLSRYLLDCQLVPA